MIKGKVHRLSVGVNNNNYWTCCRMFKLQMLDTDDRGSLVYDPHEIQAGQR